VNLGIEVVQNSDRTPFTQQAVNKVRANKSGTSSH
jgi:hypothetical protein